MTEPSTLWARARWLVPTLVGARLLLLVPFHAAFFDSDSGEYLFAAKHWTMFYDRPAGVSFFFRIVLAPWHSPLAIVLAQSILGVLAGLLVDNLLRRRGITSTPAALATIAGTMNPVTLYYERAIMSETLSLFLLVLVVWCVFRVLEEGHRAWWWAAGVAFGALVVTRSAMTPLLAVFAVVALVTGGPAVRRRLGALGLVVLGALVCMAPYMTLMADKTSREFDTVVVTPTSFDGIQWFAFVAPLVDCSATARRGDPVRSQVCRNPDQLRHHTDANVWALDSLQRYVDRVGEPTANAELRRLAIDTALHHPVGYAKRIATSTAKLFWPGETTKFRTDPAAITENRDLTQISRAVLGSAPSPGPWPEQVMRYLGEAWSTIRLVLLAATVVLLVRWRVRPRWDLGILWACFLVPCVVTVFVSLAGVRYLVPFEPLLWAQFTLLVLAYRPDRSATTAPEPIPSLR